MSLILKTTLTLQGSSGTMRVLRRKNSEKNLFINNSITMCAEQPVKKRNLLASVLQNRCPACRQGKIFKTDNAYDLKHFMEMNSHCTVCGEDLEREIGFYYGTGYVS